MTNILIGILVLVFLIVLNTYFSTKYDVGIKRVIFILLVAPLVAGLLFVLLAFINIAFSAQEFEVTMLGIFPFMAFFSLILMFPILITFAVIIFSIEKRVQPNRLIFLIWTIVVSAILVIPYCIGIEDYFLLLTAPIIMIITVTLEAYYFQRRKLK